MKFISFLYRTLFGVGDFLGSDVFKKIIDVWFKQMGWAAIATALFAIGLKSFGFVSNFFLLLGILSLIFIATYSFNFWIDEIQIEYKNSIQKINKRNSKLFKNANFKMEPYLEFPAFSAAIPILCLILLLNIATYSAIFFALSVFILN